MRFDIDIKTEPFTLNIVLYSEGFPDTYYRWEAVVIQDIRQKIVIHQQKLEIEKLKKQAGEQNRKNSEKQPKYWRNEVSGGMKQIVNKFFEGKQLIPRELKVIKDYIIQWIEKTANSVKYIVSEEEFQDYLETGVPKDYNEKIEEMDQEQIMVYIGEELLKYGIDPF